MRGDYLVIPDRYCAALGGLRWSDRGDAVELHDGGTFALAPEIHAFLEGYATRRPLMHFGHVLHFLALLRRWRTDSHAAWKLAECWIQAGKPIRTAGVVAGMLTREVPYLVSAPMPRDLPFGVSPDFLPHLAVPGIAEPTLSPDEFERLVAEEVAAIPFDDLVHWFRHGHGPVKDVAEDLAREIVETKPRSLAHVLAEVSKHDRLSGAVPFVARLVSALSLPPKRLQEPELPLGGYSDVTTRGQPEQILPGQFALDELEFLRRHAEHELLYYRREDPATQTREALVVLLDQGVRTWGRVRLALAACVFALGELARKRKLRVLLTTTGTGGHLVDPLEVTPEHLATVLAASDLTPTPGLAVETMLEEPADTPRDYILLTHPRNTEAADVRDAARRLGKGCRLFSVAVASDGDVRFSEVRHGLPVPLGKFHLDLDAATPPPPEPPATGPWKGDVEPVPFPFRFGLGSPHEQLLFAFDVSGETLLVAAPNGFLLAVRSDGSGFEMLPRPLLRGQLVTEVQQVIGVEGGFVVAAPSNERTGFIAAYYNFADRSCRVFEFLFPMKAAAECEWRYLRSRHALALRVAEGYFWVHLPTGDRTRAVPDLVRWDGASHRSGRRVQVMPYQDCLLPAMPTTERRCPRVYLDPHTGRLSVVETAPGWDEFTPVRNGEPLMKGMELTRAECRHETLAVLATGPDYRKVLELFAWPQGRPIASLNLPYQHDGFALSADGRRLAVQRGAAQVQIRDVQPGMGILGVSPVGRFHNNLAVELGEQMLVLRIDRLTHLLRWETGELVGHLLHDGQTVVGAGQLLRAQPGRVPGFLRHDRERFRLAAWWNVVVVVSYFGEVFVFEQTGDLVCGFFAFRQSLAAWMPDGTCAGPEALLGQKPWPDAGRRIGRALKAAWERGEGTIT